MLRRLVIALVVLVGLLALADRGLAMAAGNATADQIRVHEGLRERPDVRFRGFPFVTQAVHGNFRAVDVTARDVERGGLTIDRIDAHLEGVKVNLSKALKGRVVAVPVREGTATVRLTYGDLQTYLANRPGKIRIAVREGQVVVISTFGVPGAGQVEVEGTPTVKVSGDSIRVVVNNTKATVGGTRLSASLASQAGVRSSFTVPLKDLPFGIRLESAKLTDDALVVTALASGLVIDVRR
jgi:hypothetical protein